VILDTDDFKEVAHRLENFEIKHLDFEAAIASAQKGDFIFADPPYTVKHNKNNFVKYNEELFHWEKQERLRDALIAADKRGVLFVLTNAAHQSVRELYTGHFCNIIEVERRSVIASSSENRGLFRELIVRNWQ
jgi:DNA adenine methylase